MKTFEKNLENIYRENGAFFAFNDAQFEEAKVDGVKYVRLFAGLICPKGNAKKLIAEIEAAIDEKVAYDKKNRTKEDIILHELCNHEAFYVGDIQDTADALVAYGYTDEEIWEVYHKNYSKYQL